jgi:hypothetical protein
VNWKEMIQKQTKKKNKINLFFFSNNINDLITLLEIAGVGKRIDSFPTLVFIE